MTNVNPYQAQLINKWRKGSLLMARDSLFVLEVAPAAYASLAAISCAGASECWAAGESFGSGGTTTPLLENWNGKAWSLAS